MNTTTITPTAQIRGYENEEASDLMTVGLGVKAGTDADQIQIADADEEIVGVVAMDMNQGEGDPVSVHLCDGGSAYVRSGASFVRGAWLTTDSAGRFVTTAGKKQARALAAAAAANELVPALLVTSIAGATGATGATGPTGPTGATGATGGG